MKNKGITLITLIITIIILLILAGTTIAMLTEEEGILNKAKTAQKEEEEKTATEIINLKITNVQLQSYQEEEKMPDLQYLADRLYEDHEIQYVYNESKKQASLEKEKIKVTGKTIFTKLVDYPYEFEINSNLQLASINGIKVAENSSVQEVEGLKSQINALEQKYEGLVNAMNTKKQSEILTGTIKVPANSKNQGKQAKVTFDKPLENTNYTCFVCTRAGHVYWAQNSYGIGEKTVNGFVIYTWCWEGTTVEHLVDWLVIPY